jgi:hypothetical protein
LTNDEIESIGIAAQNYVDLCVLAALSTRAQETLKGLEDATYRMERALRQSRDPD